MDRLFSFSSDDLRHWQYENVLAGDEDGVIGKMWECPDFFQIRWKTCLNHFATKHVSDSVIEFQ